MEQDGIRGRAAIQQAAEDQFAYDTLAAVARVVFEEGYAERSGITRERGYELGVFPALPCACGDEMCEGWRRRYSGDA